MNCEHNLQCVKCNAPYQPPETDWLAEAMAMVNAVDQAFMFQVVRSGGNDTRPYWNAEALKTAERIVAAYKERNP